MAELPRYQAQRVRPQVSGVGARATAQAFGSLADRIEAYGGMKIQQYAHETEVEAKRDAEQAFSQKGLQAEVNKDMTVYGETYTKALSGMHKKRLAIDTGVAFDEIYNRNKDNPIAFQNASKALYSKTTELLPEHLKAEYAIDFEANKAHYNGIVSKNRIKLDRERDIALTNELFTQSSQNASRASREGNHDLAFYEIGKGITALDSALENKTITAEQHRKGVAGIKFGSSTAMFKGVNDSHIQDGDLQGSNDYIESFRTSDVQGYSDEQRERLADEMQRDLNSEIRLRDNQNKQKSKFDNKQAKDMVFLLDNAEVVDDNRYKEVLGGNISDDMRENLTVARKDNKELMKFNSLNLEEQELLLESYETIANKTADELRLEQKAKKHYEKAQKLIINDPLTYGEGKAFKTSIRPLDMQSESFMSDVSERISRFISQINELPEDIQTNTYKQFGGDIEFAGTLSAAGNAEAARLSIIGKGADVQLPENFKNDIGSKIAGAYGGYSGEYFTQNLKGIMNYARGLALEGTPVDNIDELVTNSVGKMLQYNNKTTILPQGIDEDTFEKWLDGVVIEDRPGLTKGLQDMTDFFRSGNYQLHHAGHGKYYIRVNNEGNSYFARDTEDNTKPFILDYFKDQ